MVARKGFNSREKCGWIRWTLNFRAGFNLAVYRHTTKLPNFLAMQTSVPDISLPCGCMLYLCIMSLADEA